MKENEPLERVVPERVPLALCNWRPEGKVPEAMVHWYGEVPPVAERDAAYGTPVLASVKVEVSMDKPAIGVTTTFAVAFRMRFVVLVAVIITGVLLVTFGAVKLPSLEMVPAVAVHPMPVFGVPVRVAANCWTPCDAIVVLLGETTMPS